MAGNKFLSGALIKEEELQEKWFEITENAWDSAVTQLVIVENTSDNIKFLLEKLPDNKTFKVRGELK